MTGQVASSDRPSADIPDGPRPSGGGRLGIIGGSGLYKMAALADGVWTSVDTPWGKPSDDILLGTMAGRDVAFLPRHGRGHGLMPDEIPARANIAALKALGCTEILAISAVGSYREGLPPGCFVVIDQYVDRTIRGERRFFGGGIVAHVGFADPSCRRLAEKAVSALRTLGLPYADRGTMLVMEGPQFSTRAESRLHRAQGMDVVGMTGLPEARLAREAELCYVNVAMVTDFDAWHEGAVDVAEVIRVLGENASNAQALVAEIARLGGGVADCVEGCGHALDAAVITAPASWSGPARDKLATLWPRIFA